MGRVRDGNGLRNTKKSIDAPQLQAMADLFSVLSEGSRLHLIQALQRGPSSMDELVDGTEMNEKNVVEQIELLLNSGVISQQQVEGREIYSIEMPVVLELCELACRGGVSKQAADRPAAT